MCQLIFKKKEDEKNNEIKIEIGNRDMFNDGIENNKFRYK